MDYGALAECLTVKEMREILKLRKVKSVGLFEKSEWIEQIRSSTPTRSPKVLVPGPYKWKASYAAKMVDSRRTIITKDELCSFEW
jgi:hypothetical protein